MALSPTGLAPEPVTPALGGAVEPEPEPEPVGLAAGADGSGADGPGWWFWMMVLDDGSGADGSGADGQTLNLSETSTGTRGQSGSDQVIDHVISLVFRMKEEEEGDQEEEQERRGGPQTSLCPPASDSVSSVDPSISHRSVVDQSSISRRSVVEQLQVSSLLTI